MPSEPIQRIAIVGFGEAGGIIGNDLAARGLSVSTFDILFHSKEAREAILAKARDSKARATESLSDCVRDAQLVISAVTASSAMAAAATPRSNDPNMAMMVFFTRVLPNWRAVFQLRGRGWLAQVTRVFQSA